MKGIFEFKVGITLIINLPNKLEIRLLLLILVKDYENDRFMDSITSLYTNEDT